MSVITTAIPAAVAATVAGSPLTVKQKAMVAGGAVGGGLLSVGFVTLLTRHLRKKEKKMRERILAELGVRDAVMNAARNLDPENASFNLEDIDKLLIENNKELMEAIRSGNEAAIEAALRRVLEMNDNPPDDKGPKK